MKYTIQYVKDFDGYTAQVVEWPDVVSCGTNFDECRDMIFSAIQEMMVDYKNDGKEIPKASADVIIENVEVACVS